MNNAPQPIKDLNALDFSRKRRIWKPFMEKYNCQKIAEAGIFEGYNFKLMIEHNPELAVGVDMWLETGIPSQNDCGFTQEKLDKMSSDFIREVYQKPFVKIIRGDTVSSIDIFPDEYFDLIYIDADHTYEGCKRDIEAWYPKVKRGGFATGDDYSHYHAKYTGVKFGVVEAVNEFFKNKGLDVYELPRHGWAVIKQ